MALRGAKNNDGFGGKGKAAKACIEVIKEAL
jgi:hypothetical protein